MDAKRLRAIVSYDPLTGHFVWLVSHKRIKAGCRAGSVSQGYRNIQIEGKSYRAHRLAWLYMTGDWPRLNLDHKNGIRSDNRFSNLREATKSDNAANSHVRRDSQSKIRGVGKRGRYWVSQICRDGKRVYIGIYKSSDEARLAYMAKAHELFGEFVRAESETANVTEA